MRQESFAVVFRSQLAMPSKLRIALRFLLIAGTTLLLTIALSLGFASAGNTGLQTQEALPASSATTANPAPALETSVLTSAASRDMTQAVEDVQAQEEAARIAAEEAAREAEAKKIVEAQDAQAKSAASGGVGMYEVDFSIGEEAFIEEWTRRIDSYLAGSPLAGYGSTFAEAAWRCGVDPRWSPAISNTESTKGANCFAPHNAWGWTGGSWSNWTTAINAHVRGLADMYGFTISYANAKKYCPPNCDNWYRDTLNEMNKI